MAIAGKCSPKPVFRTMIWKGECASYAVKVAVTVVGILGRT